MNMTDENMQKVLKNKRILMVEDDDELIKRLEPEFMRYGMNPFITRWADAGYEELCNNISEYDILIIDVKIPQTQDAYKEIQKCKKELKKFRDLWAKVDTPAEKEKEFSEKLDVARDKRPMLIYEIENLTQIDGGIKIIEEYLNQQNIIPHKLGAGEYKQSIEDLKEPKDKKIIEIPVVYFTCIGTKEYEDIIRRGESVAKYSAWIVKPVAVELLLETIVNLTNKIQSK